MIESNILKSNDLNIKLYKMLGSNINSIKLIYSCMRDGFENIKCPIGKSLTVIQSKDP